jgi:hypothetical protein
MDQEQLDKLKFARDSYKRGKKFRDFGLLQTAFDSYKVFYDEALLTDNGDLNAFLTCCKWLKVPETKQYFVKAFFDLDAGKIRLRVPEDANHIKRNYINFLIDNTGEYLEAEKRINEIKSKFKNDYQLYDIEAKLYSRTNRILETVRIFDEKSKDWDMQKRSKSFDIYEWDMFHNNFYSMFVRYIEDNFLNEKKGYNSDQKMKHAQELKLVILKAEEIILRLPKIKTNKGAFIVGNAKDVLIKLDKKDESIIPRTKVFISYSHEDRDKWLALIKKFLKPLEKDGLIIWTDEKIKVGEEWKKDIEFQLLSAKVGLLIITQSFLNSDFIDKNELPPLIKARKEGMILIPLLCENCSFTIDERLNHFDARPKPLVALEEMNDAGKNKALTNLLMETKKYLDEEKKKLK